MPGALPVFVLLLQLSRCCASVVPASPGTTLKVESQPFHRGDGDTMRDILHINVLGTSANEVMQAALLEQLTEYTRDKMRRGHVHHLTLAPIGSASAEQAFARRTYIPGTSDLDYIGQFVPDRNFVKWVRSAFGTASIQWYELVEQFFRLLLGSVEVHASFERVSIKKILVRDKQSGTFISVDLTLYPPDSYSSWEAARQVIREVAAVQDLTVKVSGKPANLDIGEMCCKNAVFRQL